MGCWAMHYQNHPRYPHWYDVGIPTIYQLEPSRVSPTLLPTQCITSKNNAFNKKQHRSRQLMRDGGVIFSPSSWEPQEEGMMNIAARFFPQLRNQGMSVKSGRSQTTEGDAC
jgi:hypothetical protein